MKIEIIDGVETEVLEPGDEGYEAPVDEDRGDELPTEDDEIEVDEEVLAALSAYEPAGDQGDHKKNSLYKERRLLQEENERLRAELAAKEAPAAAAPAKEEVPAFDVDAKEAEYANALIDGDLDKAKSLRKEIKEYETNLLKDELRKEREQADNAKTVAQRLQGVINQAFADHPQLNHENKDTYNPDLVGKINRMAKAYEAEGKPADEALATAISDFIPKKEESVDPEAAKKAAEAAAEAKKRNAKAAAAQPPGLGGVGTGERAAASAVSIEDMTDAEFNALPEREKKRLRGD